MKGFTVSFIFAMFAVTAVCFSNCSSSHTNENTGNYSLDCSMTKMRSTFETGYWNYLKQSSCSGCHSGKGVAGIPPFADDNFRDAILAFIPLGPRKISAKLEIGHQSYNYTNMKPALDSLQDEWESQKALTGCDDYRLTAAKTLTVFDAPATAGQQGIVNAGKRTPQTIEWDLSSRVAGASISANITVDVNGSGMPLGYVVDAISVKSPNFKIRVKNIKVMLNDSDYFNTTFKIIDTTVNAGTSYTPLLSGGASAYFEKSSGELYLNSDQWRLNIEIVAVSN